jgi:hypothetical protein
MPEYNPMWGEERMAAELRLKLGSASHLGPSDAICRPGKDRRAGVATRNSPALNQLKLARL